MEPVPANAIFVESDEVVYYVTNWQKRRTVAAKALLIRLSRRHLQRYFHMKAKGRSQKSIYYFVFGGSAKRGPAATGRTGDGTARTTKSGFTDVVVAVPLGLLNAEQLLSLIQARVGSAIPRLRSTPVADLRKLYLALGGGSQTAPGVG